jgi:hypothetical protein
VITGIEIPMSPLLLLESNSGQEHAPHEDHAEPFVDCPDSGNGVHLWFLSEANRCRNHGLKPTETEQVLTMGSANCGRDVPQREIDDALRKAYQKPAASSRRNAPGASCRRNAPAASYDRDALGRVAAACPDVDEAWLRARSPELPDTVSPPGFLNAVFGPGERGLVFDALRGNPFTWRCGRVRSLDEWQRTINTRANVFFLCNPVDGEEHWNPRTKRTSVRSAESITEFRYAVIESDLAPANPMSLS